MTRAVDRTPFHPAKKTLAITQLRSMALTSALSLLRGHSTAEAQDPHEITTIKYYILKAAVFINEVFKRLT